MTFTSVTFAVFLVVVFTAYWLLPRRSWQNWLLASASFVFYGWWDGRFCALLAGSALCDFALGLGLGVARGPRARKALLIASCAGNLGLLGLFKYFNFFQDNLLALLGRLGWHAEPLALRLLLPVGISFYTFQSLSYIFDVYRGVLRPTRDPLEYLAFVSFFPQLLAGPIERAVNLLPQFQAPRTFDGAAAADGCRQALLGFAKKLVLADNLAPHVEAAFGHPAGYPGWGLLLATVFFAFQIYCDFSAYSDIALGVSRLFGFRLSRNFAYPYFAQDLAEFWRRWHISLSSWFRDYVYLPLGGGRAGRWRGARNVLVTFLLSGLWHGAAWNFVLWGLLHGLGVAACRLTTHRREAPAAAEGPALVPSPAAAVRMAATFFLVCVGWVFFRARDVGQAWTVLRLAFTRPLTPLSPGEAVPVAGPTVGTLLGLVLAFVALEWLQQQRPHPLAGIGRLPRPVRWAVYTGLFWGAVYLHPGNTAPFIYFQF